MRRVLTVVGMMMAGVTMAQDGGYRTPLDGVLRLSGNFGEVRSNHFHAGLDLKTDGAEGKAVHAIADGHIVRVNVSPTGYGKALYVEHPDGKTSVYAHLREFGAEVNAYVKQQQYAEEKFAVDLTIPKGKFVVKRGDVIAKSGNSGGSGGPHLHFEIRDTESQAPLNPLDHGFKVADDNAPEMQRLWIYNHAKNGHVDGLTHERAFELERKGNAYTIKGKRGG
jgi:murein DD-endopeptidase MepM/ murein hydrolase activator NlpD